MEGLEQQLLTDLRDRQDRLEEEFHSSQKRTEEMAKPLESFTTTVPTGDKYGKTCTR